MSISIVLMIINLLIISQLASGWPAPVNIVLNRANKRLDLQVNCIFKDEQGFATGDETPFRTLILDETAQETVLFTSLNPKAKNYTVRVRLSR